MENIVIDNRTEADKAYDSFYRINVHRWDEFMKKIERLDKRAVKMGCSPIVVEVLGQMKKIVDKKTGETEVYNCVTITGEAPSYKGWTFIASLEHTAAGNIVRTVPGFELPEKYRHVENYCEHCNSRRRRKETFIVLHEDGTYKQVGRNCIADFLGGHPDPEMYGRWFDLWDKIEEEANSHSGGGYSGERIFDLNTYMAFVVECIERFGWVSQSHAREQMEYYDRYIEATAWRAIRNLLPARNKHEQERKDFEVPSEASIEKAKVIVEWAKALKDRPDLNDYLHNLTVIANNGYVTSNKMAFAASMANAYQMELDNIEYQARKAKEKAEKPVSQYVGEVGKRMEFTVTVKKVLKFESRFGVTKFHIMEDEDGNNLVWYASNEQLDEGETYKLKATVKEHKEYNGEKQTVLTRCAVI